MRYSVLVVDDDPLVNEVLLETATGAGFETASVSSGEEAIIEFEERPFDIVLCDLKMKGMDGLEVLRQIKKINPSTEIIMITAYGSVETAVKAIKQGAHDFLLKPVTPDTVLHYLNRITEMLELKEENERMRQEFTHQFQNLIGKSKVMSTVYDQIRSVADARSTVMITGESGTGKELVARAIHYSSNRRENPFIKLNCAALPETLVEAELFGHEKGAFTDAKKMTRGRFELADKGTLLMDEISEMPMNLQSKLLRVLQEREFERLGSSKTIAVDVRIIATSNRNLKEEIGKGRFREDLFFRLNVIPIHITPLRDRKEDVLLLSEHFIHKYNGENNKSVKGIDATAHRLLMKYHWPGNVRELENLIERAVVTTTNQTLSEDDFPTELALGPAAQSLPDIRVPMKLEEGSKYLILKTLEKFNGNKTKAAEALGITTRTIRNKLAEYSIEIDTQN